MKQRLLVMYLVTMLFVVMAASGVAEEVFGAWNIEYCTDPSMSQKLGILQMYDGSLKMLIFDDYVVIARCYLGEQETENIFLSKVEDGILTCEDWKSFSYKVENDCLTLLSDDTELYCTRYYSPESDFQWYQEGGYATLYEYNGEDMILSIPARIDKKRVKMSDMFRFQSKIANYHNTATRYVFVPEGINEIEHFSYFSSIEFVHLSNSVTTIAPYAFSNAKELRSINFPTALRMIGSGAFTGTEALHSISLNDGISAIGDNSFSHSGLTEISFPSSLCTIGKDAFSECAELEDVIINQPYITVGDCINSNKNLKKVVFTGKQINFAAGSFSMCQMLEEIIYENPNAQIISSTLAFPDSGQLQKNGAVSNYSYPEIVEYLIALSQREAMADKLLSAEKQLQRWIDSGKKSESDIQKQRKKVQQYKDELAQLTEQISKPEKAEKWLQEHSIQGGLPIEAK